MIENYALVFVYIYLCYNCSMRHAFLSITKGIINSSSTTCVIYYSESFHVSNATKLALPAFGQIYRNALRIVNSNKELREYKFCSHISKKYLNYLLEIQLFSASPIYILGFLNINIALYNALKVFYILQLYFLKILKRLNQINFFLCL